MGDEGDVEAGVAAGYIADGVEGGEVVGVDTGEDVEIPVTDGGEVALEHLANDAGFVPEGDEDGDGALGAAVEVGCMGARESARRKEVDERDEEIVQPADQDPGRDGNQTGQDPLVEAVEWNCRNY
jgi:hypothetical protein